MLSCNFWQGRTTSMTKRGNKSAPMIVKFSCSNFLSAYSSGKFFCIMLFSVTLQIHTHKLSERRVRTSFSVRKLVMKFKKQCKHIAKFSVLESYHFRCQSANDSLKIRQVTLQYNSHLIEHVLGLIKRIVRHNGHLLPIISKKGLLK